MARMTGRTRSRVLVRGGALAAAAVTALVLAACAADATPAAEDDDPLVAAAQAEGSVTWYTGSEPGTAQAFADKFTEVYGIPVNFTRMNSADLSQRYLAESAAEAPQADVISTVDPQFLQDIRDSGDTVALSASDFGDFPEEFMLGDAAVVTTVSLFVVPYNTDVLGDFEPKGWEDLTDPALQGEILIVDPRLSAAWAQFWSTVLHDDRLGPDLIEAIGAQSPRAVAATPPGVELLAAGEGGVLIAGLTSNIEAPVEAGAPLDYFTPQDPAMTTLQWTAVSAKSPHPNAGMLFARYLQSEEGQQFYNSRMGQASPLGSLPDVVDLPSEILETPSPEQVETDLPEVVRLLNLQ